MATGLFNWSRTPASNANATYNWAEGQAPSTVNDSARGIMSDVAQWRDDIAGAIVTGGSSTAYTVTSYSTFTSLASMNGQMIAFTPHATNDATVTLDVDGLGAKPLRSSPGVELAAGTLVLGTPYTCTYNNSDAAFYLQNFYGSNPYNVPLMGGMDYWDTVAPNSAFIFPAGQAISRTTYAAVFARWGTTYGVGDGSTTFNVPDKTERVSVMKASSASRLTSTYFGGNSTVMGATGGSESHTLTTAQLASHRHGVVLTDPGHTHGTDAQKSAGFTAASGVGAVQGTGTAATVNSATTGLIIQDGAGNLNVTAFAGSGSAHNNTQPTIVCNYIIRVL